MRAQTVDVTIREEQDVVWADTLIGINLYNAGRTPMVVPVTMPGPQLAPVPLPEALQVTLENTPLQLTLLPPSDDQPQIRVTTPVTVPAQGAARLRISYRQALPEEDGLVTFAYLLTATASWSGRPESLRVTVRFDPPLKPQQILGHAPVADRQERAALTWHWENVKASQNVGIAFMAPSWWAGFEAARWQAAADAGLAEHVLVAERYWYLANLPPPLFQSEGYFQRFFSLAVAALQTGITNPGSSAAPEEIAAAHIRLADFYRTQAGRLAPDAATPYLQLAASELQAALALRPADDVARQTAGDLHRQLLALARERGDALAAQEHEVRLAALATEAGLPAELAVARVNTLYLAELAAAHGDLITAARLVTDLFGEKAAIRPDAPPPRITQTRISVITSPTRRTFHVQAGGNGSEVEALLAQAGSALAGLAQVEITPGRLVFSLPYTDTRRLQVMQSGAAAAVADLPELALLVAALTPPQQSWNVEVEPFAITERYVEMADLRSARTTWEARAQALTSAAALASATEGTVPEARLARLQALLWAGHAAAWRDLADRSRTAYRAELATQDVIREWEVAAGEVREISAHATQWRYDRLGWVAGGASLLLLVMVFVVWRAATAQ